MCSSKNCEDLKRCRFSPEDDIFLLREVIGENPMANPEIWVKICDKLKNITRKLFTVRALKDRLQLLLETFLKKDRENKNK